MTGKTFLDFFMACVASLSMELEYVKGDLWYIWYRMRFTSFRSRK